MSENSVVYSIQQTYILSHVLTPEREIVTCNQRIDIPEIEPLPNVEVFNVQNVYLTVIPCIELAGADLSEFNLTFETNEGVTVLPIKIGGGYYYPVENPYTYPRDVLVLPRGATGVKTCKIIHKATGKEVQHNLTFGVMPPPYNYDNMLFGPISALYIALQAELDSLEDVLSKLKLTTSTPTFSSKELPKGAGKQTIVIERGVLFYNTWFSYPLSPEPTIHKPKITFHDGGRDQVYTLSLNKTINTVSIDLFTGMITVYDGDTGEILTQFKLAIPPKGFETLSFENFDDIDSPTLSVKARGAYVE